MFRLQPYLLRMGIFLALIAAVAAALQAPLRDAFMSNAPLNGLILGTLALGILFAFRQVLVLRHDAAWIEAYKRTRNAAERDHLGLLREGSLPEPKLLAPMAAMLKGSRGTIRLTSGSMRSILDTIASRLDESRAMARYLIGLLIFLGLLGTFWGLLLTINSVSDVIGGLNIGSGNMADVFANLKAGLAAPLAGMGTAFSSSLFGLAGSLVLGFLDLQSAQAQNRFYNDLEEWLSGQTRLSAALPASLAPAGDGAIPDYVQALLEQTAEGLDSLQRILARGEDSRASANAAVTQLAEKVSALTDQMRTEQSLMVKLAETQTELKPLIGRLAERLEHDTAPLDEATRGHIRNIEVYMARLLEETSAGRGQLVEEIRSEIKLLARTVAAGAGRARQGSA